MRAMEVREAVENLEHLRDVIVFTAKWQVEALDDALEKLREYAIELDVTESLVPVNITVADSVWHIDIDEEAVESAAIAEVERRKFETSVQDRVAEVSAALGGKAPAPANPSSADELGGHKAVAS